MTSATLQHKSFPITLVFIVITSFLVTLGLFYIDEGNYSLKGITHPGNIIALSVYFIGLFSGQWLAGKFLFQKSSGLEKIIITVLVGLPIGFLIGLGLIYSLPVVLNFLNF